MPSSAVYATVAQVRSFGVSAADAADAVVSDALASASRWVDGVTQQQQFGFGAPVAASLTLREVSGPVVALPAPVSAITAVTVNSTVQADLAAWVVEGVDGRLLRFAPSGFTSRIGGRSGSMMSGYAASLTIAGTWGYPTVPGLVSKACWLYAAYQLVTAPTFRQLTAERIGQEMYQYALAGDTLADLALQALCDGGFLSAVLA
jgi:hypothetical protein